VRYEALKKQTVARNPQDQRAYVEGKNEYVAALDAQAVMCARRSRRVGGYG
jgi:hypothetical protein